MGNVISHKRVSLQDPVNAQNELSIAIPIGESVVLTAASVLSENTGVPTGASSGQKRAKQRGREENRFDDDKTDADQEGEIQDDPPGDGPQITITIFRSARSIAHQKQKRCKDGQDERTENDSDATGEDENNSGLQPTQPKEASEEQERRPKRSKAKWDVLQSKHASLVANHASEEENSTMGSNSSTPVGRVTESMIVVQGSTDRQSSMVITERTGGDDVEAHILANTYARNDADTAGKYCTIVMGFKSATVVQVLQQTIQMRE